MLISQWLRELKSIATRQPSNRRGSNRRREFVRSGYTQLAVEQAQVSRLVELLEVRAMLSSVQVVTSGAGQIELPDFDETLGTLQQADVAVSVDPVNTGTAALPDANHAHTVTVVAQGGGTVGGQQFLIPLLAANIGNHTHAIPIQQFGVPLWNNTSSNRTAPIQVLAQSDPDIHGQTHTHGLPNLIFDTLGGTYTILVGGIPQVYAVGTGSATNGVFVPKRPISATVIHGLLTVRIRAATSPSASAGDFSHTHTVTTSSGPFSSSGVTSSVNPSGNSNHSHAMNVTVDPKTFTDPAELATRFANGSNINLSASVGTSFDHTHSVPNLTTSATTTFTFDAVPVSNTGGNYVGDEGETIRFDGSSSTDDVGIGLFEWDFDYNGTDFTTDASGPVIFRSFGQDFPTRTVALRTTDTLGQQTISTTSLTVNNVSPIVQPLREQSSQPGVAADIDLGTFADPGSDGPFSVVVNWGDGTPDSTFSVNTPGPLGTLSHTFAAAGSYTVRATVTEASSGVSGENTGLFQVNNLPAATLNVSETDVDEAAGTVTATVQLDSPATANVSVNLIVTGTATVPDDVTIASTIVEIEQGQSTATVSVSIVDDLIHEQIETLTLTLSSAVNARIGNVAQQTVNISDNDLAPRVSFTQVAQVAPEGSDAIITARLSSLSGTDVIVPLSFAGSTTLDVDYFSSTGPELTIPAGQLTATATISVLDDTLGESNELIDVIMLTPVGAVLSVEPGEVIRHSIRIPFSDVPTVGFTSVNQRLLEAQETFDVNLRLSGPSDQTITVDLQKPGTNTPAETIAVTFAPGETLVTQSFSIDDNSLTEPDQNLQFTLASPQNALLGNPLHVTTVKDDDVSVVSITTGQQEHFEDVGQFSFDVELSQTATFDVVVPLSLNGTARQGADYTVGSTSVTIPAGQTSANVVVTVNDDGSRERAETLYVSLNDPQQAGVQLGEDRTHVVVLRDDDPEVGFSSATRGVDEDDGTVSVTARLSAVTNKPVVVPIYVQMDTAFNSLQVPPALGDFTSPPVFAITIPAGASSASASVLQIIDDFRDESRENLLLRMGPAANASLATSATTLSRQQRITIYDNDAPLSTVSFTTSSKTVNERAGSVEIAARLSSTRSNDVRVRLRYAGTAKDGSDYSGPAEILIPAGSRQGSASIPIINDSTPNEGDETIRVSMNGTFGGAKPVSPTVVTFTIRDDDRAASVPQSNSVKSTPGNANKSNAAAVFPPLTINTVTDVGSETEQIDSDLAAELAAAGALSADVPDPEYQSVDSLQPFRINVIVPGGAFSGSTVFFDANFNRVLDPDEPSAISQYDGTVSLTIPESFDLDDNLVLDLSEGQLVVVGGVDTATNLPLQVRLTAPAGFFAASMMSTVVNELIHEHGLSLVDAQTRVLQAMNLPAVDLFAFDIVNRAAAGDSNAASVFAGLAKLENTIVAISKLVSGISSAPPIDIIGDQVFADIAQKIFESGSRLDLNLSGVVSSLIDGALFASGLNLDTVSQSGAADIVAESNQRISDIPLAATSAYLTKVAKVQSLVQGEIGDQLQDVGAGTAAIATVLSNYTGANLTAAIAAATTGNVVAPALFIDDAVQSEGDAGDVSYEFRVFLLNAPVEPVTVNWSTSDDSATVVDGDYQATGGQLSWAAGDTTPRTITVVVSADTQAEADETFKVVLDNAVNATIRRAIGYGFVLNDDTVNHSTSDVGAANQTTLTVDRDQIILVENDELLSSGGYYDPQNVVINGQDDVDDTLLLDFATGTYRSDTITFDGGGGTGFDTAIVSGGEFETVTVALANATDGQTILDPVDSNAMITLNWMGLEPFVFTSPVANFVFDLPAGTTSAVLEDIDPADSSQPGVMRLFSPDGHFEEQIFPVPSGSLTIRGGDGADTITIASLDPAFIGSFVIDADQLGSDAVDLTINAISQEVTLDLQAATIDLAQAVDTGSGNVHVDGTVQVNANLTTSGTVTVVGGTTTTGPGNVSAGATIVASSATLQGDGSIIGPLTVNSGGTLGPGASTAILDVDAVTLESGSTFTVELNGTPASTNYDQLRAAGLVTVSGASLDVQVGFTPTAGNSFIIIDNQSGSAVAGAIFNGLGDQATFTSSGTKFQIDYQGGDGDDVELTVLNTPPIAKDDAVATNEDSTLLIDVLADNGNGDDSDAEGNLDPTLTISLTSPLSGTLTNHNDGTLTFDPDGAFDSLPFGQSASETFDYQIEDTNGATDSATATITVIGVNDAPLITTDNSSVAVYEGTTAFNSGTVSDVDLGNTVVLSASVGIVINSGNGTWSWSLDNADGPDDSQTVTITADDGTVQSDSTFTLNIQNVVPTLTLDPLVAITENDTATLSGTINDPGTLDTFTLDIDWGDSFSPNDTQLFSLGATNLTLAGDGIDWNPATRQFSVEHQYLDDNPTITDHDTYTIGATVADDDQIAASMARVSVVSRAGNGTSNSPSTSADGRYVAFESSATNLVPGDNNGTQDIFVKDRQTGEVTRVSVDSAGVEGNGYSGWASISADGQFVAFHSGADNLVVGDNNGNTDIFLHDRQTGLTTRVSVDSNGVEANGYSTLPEVSGNGQFIAFQSAADNLVAGDNNASQDVFVHDRLSGLTTRVSVDSNGIEANAHGSGGISRISLSNDGQFVAFASEATNLVTGDTNAVFPDDKDVFVHDRQSGQTTRVSVDSSAVQGNGSSQWPSMSADGRFVAFRSRADNLVTGDTNALDDIFVHDRQTGQTTRVSVDSNGNEATGSSSMFNPSISGDGGLIAFSSANSTLVPADPNGSVTDIFVHDRQTGETTRVSIDSAGVKGNSTSVEAAVSANGEFIAFFSNADNLIASDGNETSDVFVHEVQTGVTTRASERAAGLDGNAGSGGGAVSSDGRFTVFGSSADNLVLGDTNGVSDIFVHDALWGETTRVSIDSSGTEANGQSFGARSISADGRLVVFESHASNLVPSDTNGAGDIFVHDRQTGETTRVSVDSAGVEANGHSSDSAISGDGRFVVFGSSADNLVPSDTNNVSDIFVHDRQTEQTTRVSVNSSGIQSNAVSFLGSLSNDGRYVAFTSSADNLVALDTNGVGDAFVHDRQTNQTIRVSVDSSGLEGDGQVAETAISGDGQSVVFSSDATNLVTGDTNGVFDAFVHNLQTGITKRVSVDSAGNEANQFTFIPGLSDDGRYVTFSSTATNLVPGDTHGTFQIYVHDVQTGETVVVSTNQNGDLANAHTLGSSISANGRFVVFGSSGSNMVANDLNGEFDVFLRDFGNPREPSTATASILVNNDVPKFEAGTNESTLPAALGAFSRNISFTDAGTLDEHTVTINYGDSAIDDTFVLPLGDRSFGLSHTYLTAGDFTVTVTVEDDDSGTLTDTFIVTVLFNTPPIAVDDDVYTDEDSAVLFDVLADNGSGPDTDEENNINTALTVALTVPTAGTLTNHNDGTFTFDPNGEFETLGTGQSTEVMFDYQIQDTFGEVNSATVTVTINGANDGPQISADNAAVTTDEGISAANSGSFSDIDTGDVVAVIASFGTVSDNGDGTWTWTTTSGNGPNDTQAVTITATDTSNAVATATFALTVNNVDPTLSVDTTAVVIDEGTYTSKAITTSDVPADTVSVVASIGSITDNGGGSWTWNYDGTDDLATTPVTITAKDEDGGLTTAAFDLTVDNVDPSLTVDSTAVVINEGTYTSKAITTSDVPADTVSVAASIGSITDNGGGSWTWNYDGIDDLATTAVIITATDEDGGLTTSSFDLTVNNVDPSLTIDTTAIVIDEGSSTSKAITTSDVPADTVSVVASIGSISDNGGGSWTWNYDGTDDLATTSVNVTATDEDGGLTTASFDLTVNNAAPVIVQLDSSSGSLITRSDDGVVTIDGTFSDIGTLDTHTIAVDWGDGSPITAVTNIDQTADTFTFTDTHDYVDGGIYTVMITLTDDDGQWVSQSTSAVVTGVGVVDGTLFIIGTDGKDHVQIKIKEKNDELKVDAKLNQGSDGGSDGAADTSGEASVKIKETFIASSIDRIVTHLFAGDDHYDGGSDGGSDGGADLAAPQFVFGGDGKDKISGGRGNDLLFGGAGRDNIKGGHGADIIVGGDDRDKLKGGRGNDLLIGGELNVDWENALEFSELDSALTEWAAGDLADTMNILGNVLDDDDQDDLIGGKGLDTLIGGYGDRKKP